MKMLSDTVREVRGSGFDPQHYKNLILNPQFRAEDSQLPTLGLKQLTAQFL
jgi:hypothetical protein